MLDSKLSSYILKKKCPVTERCMYKKQLNVNDIELSSDLFQVIHIFS